MKDALGRYRINVVAELTGVPAATLRAWERRYGVPTPVRTAAAYRLYSDADVVELKHLRDLCAGGMAIAEAARMVRGDRILALTPVPPPGELPQAPTLALDAILAAVRDFDPQRIDREAGRALYVGNALEVFDLVFTPALHRIGDLWHEGSLSVAQEHVASAIIEGVTSSLVRLTQPSDARWRVLLACAEEEDHCIGLHGVAIRLATWGIRSVLLGARTPPQALNDAINLLGPDGVGLSVTTTHEPPYGATLVDAYVTACAGRPLFVGGACAAELAEQVRARGGLAIVGALSDHRVAIERALTQHSPPRA